MRMGLPEPGGAIRFHRAAPGPVSATSVTGAYPLDIDSDGLLDLVVLRAGKNLILRGGEDCAFQPFDSLGFHTAEKWTTGFSATWEAGQYLPTLAFGNYVDRNDPSGPFRACDDNMLYRPDEEVYGTPHPLAPGFCTLSMLFSDWGRQGHADLRISNDRHYYVDQGQEQMWAMGDVPRLFTGLDGWQDHKLWGMGIASRDLTGDGLPEVFLTSMGDQHLQSMVSADRPDFRDVPYSRGITAHRPYQGGDGRPSTGWHVAIGDIQNDGRDDIFVSKGNVDQMPDSAVDDPNNLLVQSVEGNFAEMGGSAGIASPHRGRGAVLADFNGDGLLDLAVNNRRAPLEVWQNISEQTGNWVSVSIEQPAPNTMAVGAWIELRVGDRIMARELTVGGGHAGGSALPEHFGLGDATEVSARVIWPDGPVSNWVDLAINTNLKLRRNRSDLIVDGQ